MECRAFSASSSSDEDYGDADVVSTQLKGHTIHSVDFSSETFRCLPTEVQHEILLQLKDTRKQNSWGRIHEMPQVCTILNYPAKLTAKHTDTKILLKLRLRISLHFFISVLYIETLTLMNNFHFIFDYFSASHGLFWVSNAAFIEAKALARTIGRSYARNWSQES